MGKEEIEKLVRDNHEQMERQQAEYRRQQLEFEQEIAMVSAQAQAAALMALCEGWRNANICKRRIIVAM